MLRTNISALQIMLQIHKVLKVFLFIYKDMSNDLTKKNEDKD